MPLETNPVRAALERLRRCDYPAAADILEREYAAQPHRAELARVANLIRPCGMIPEAITALHGLAGNVEEYQANPPADQSIGLIVPAPKMMLPDQETFTVTT